MQIYVYSEYQCGRNFYKYLKYEENMYSRYLHIKITSSRHNKSKFQAIVKKFISHVGNYVIFVNLCSTCSLNNIKTTLSASVINQQ